MIHDRGHLVAALIGYCTLNSYSYSIDGDTFSLTCTCSSGVPGGFHDIIVPGFHLEENEHFEFDTLSKVLLVFLDHVAYTGEARNSSGFFLSRCPDVSTVIAEQNAIAKNGISNRHYNNNSSQTSKAKKHMKKIVFSVSLISRLKAAKANGSVFASIILEESKKEHSVAIPNSIANHFDTVLIRNSGIPSQLKVSCCNKVDDERNPNHGNPQFPYLTQNRTRIELWNFATLFNKVVKASDNMESAELDYQTKLFQECMLIGEEIIFRVGTTVADFEFAYNGSNYIPFDNEGTLQNSCMRHDHYYQTASNFYSFFAGAKILIGQTASGQVVSRALLWDGLTDASADTDNNITCFVDRVYVSHSHLVKRMQAEALRLGYAWRKAYNDYASQRIFTNMITGETVEHDVYRTVPANKWHKGGAPYCDTMMYIQYLDGKLFLANTTNIVGYTLYTLQETSGRGYRHNTICPICGEVHDRGVALCHACSIDNVVTAFDGSSQYKNVGIVDGVAYPKAMVKNGALTKLAQLAMQVNKIGEDYIA